MIEEHAHTAVPEVQNSQRTWRSGTLVYTKAGIVALFVFLLWGNFSFTLMMQVVPSILPLKLKSLGASDWLIGLLLSSVFPMFGIVISPYLSFKSDYLRTRWGRRIPFFFFSLPLVTLSIVLLAFSEDIASFLRHSGLLANMSPATAAVGVMGACIIAFQLSDVIVCSVYNYIFNDTVPIALIGRFVGFIQVIGGAVTFIFNFFIFKYAESHYRQIFIGTAIVYFLGIGMMCVFVKEGAYPPVTEEDLKKTRGLSGFKTYFRECFSHKFYWTKFLYAMSPAFTAALWPFNVFFYKEMGLSLDYVGKAAAVTSLAGIAAAYFASVFVERWHPLRIITYSAVFAAALSLSGWVWLFVTLPPTAFFWLNMLGVVLIGAFHQALCGVSAMPFDIRLLPKSRYGQFCSAQGIITNLCKVVAGICAGFFFTFLKETFFHGSSYTYRFSFVWTALANLLLACIICSLYRQWKALGGDLHFQPPAPWSQEGYEEMEQTPFVDTQSRWLILSLKIIHSLLACTIVYLALITFRVWSIGWFHEAHVFILAILPIAIATYLFWLKIERSIKADLMCCADGKPMKDGIPHHGIFFVKACVLFLGMPVSISTLIVAIQDGLHAGVVVFGMASQITNVSVLAAVLVLCRLERGFRPMLNYDGRKQATEATGVAVPGVSANEAECSMVNDAVAVELHQ